MPYLPVNTHSYVYAHGLYYLHKQCVPKSPKRSLWYRVYILFADVFIEATVYSDYIMVWEQWISLIYFSSTQSCWSQKPPETVSEIEKLKKFLGNMPPDPLVYESQ